MDRIAGVLAQLWKERQRLAVELADVDRAIALIEKAMGTESSLPVTSPPPATPAASGPYVALGLYEAVADYLARAGTPKTSREIADALRAGGYATNSTNLTSTVLTMLKRHESAMHYGIRRTDNKKRWFVKTSR